ncbi:MAG: putative motility protein [Clostridiales bacterium]|uniref:YjfB family protein n=1 Tax=Roseburia sp. MSJ-14 TaxID=2841514 RepID=UPI0016A2D5B9|nr:YjfB family protein [Roseburia sp. MSJ-14]MBU5474974.1 YjfB family protein [Roseburia sp. MSJ-14]NLK78023.1 putative motility protein [Clostridiales bacterium]
MDIASLSTALSTTQLQNDVGVLMLGKQLDTVEVMGDSMIKMMEQSVNPHLGANIDISI